MSRSVKSRRTAAKLGGPLGVTSLNSAASSLRRRFTFLRNAARCLVRSGAPPSPAASQSAAAPSSRARRMPPTPPAATTGLRLAAGGWPERSKTTLHQPHPILPSASSYYGRVSAPPRVGRAPTLRAPAPGFRRAPHRTVGPVTAATAVGLARPPAARLETATPTRRGGLKERMFGPATARNRAQSSAHPPGRLRPAGLAPRRTFTGQTGGSFWQTESTPIPLERRGLSAERHRQTLGRAGFLRAAVAAQETR